MNRWVQALLVLSMLFASCGRDTATEDTPRSTTTASPTPSPTAEPTPTPPPDPFALAKSYEASSADALAERLTAAERTLRGNGPYTEAARVQQASYRQLVTTPDWREPVFNALPEGFRRSARANVEAGAELRALTAPRTELPPWTIIEPPPADELRSHYDAAAKEFGIDWSYLAAIHLSETRMGRIRGDSHAGAKGPMQFLPQTWAAYGEGDINNPRDAIRAAARYLKAHGAPGDMDRAIYAYNHSDHYVRAITIYAEQMRVDERTYNGYYNWQVYYRTVDKGDALLYEGWPN